MKWLLVGAVPAVGGDHDSDCHPVRGAGHRPGCDCLRATFSATDDGFVIVLTERSTGAYVGTIVASSVVHPAADTGGPH